LTGLGAAIVAVIVGPRAKTEVFETYYTKEDGLWLGESSRRRYGGWVAQAEEQIADQSDGYVQVAGWAPGADGQDHWIDLRGIVSRDGLTEIVSECGLASRFVDTIEAGSRLFKRQSTGRRCVFCQGVVYPGPEAIWMPKSQLEIGDTLIVDGWRTDDDGQTWRLIEIS